LLPRRARRVKLESGFLALYQGRVDCKRFLAMKAYARGAGGLHMARFLKRAGRAALAIMACLAAAGLVLYAWHVRSAAQEAAPSGVIEEEAAPAGAAEAPGAAALEAMKQEALGAVAAGDAGRVEAICGEMSGAYGAGAAQALMAVGKAWRRAGQPEEAGATFAEIARQWPGAPEAAMARAHWVGARIEMKQYEEAEAETAALEGEYAGQPAVLARVAQEIGYTWCQQKRPEKGAPWLGYAAANLPEGPARLRARRDLACALIRLGEYEAGEAQAGQLFAEGAGQEVLPRMAWDLADAWKARGRMDKAVEMLERAVQGEMVNPGKNARVRRDAIRARRDLIRARIAVGQEEAAGAETAAMAAEYADHALIGEMVSDVADAWREAGQTAKAVEVMEGYVAGAPAGQRNEVNRHLLILLMETGQVEAAQEQIRRVLAEQAEGDLLEGEAGYWLVKEFCQYPGQKGREQLGAALLAEWPAGKGQLWRETGEILRLIWGGKGELAGVSGWAMVINHAASGELARAVRVVGQAFLSVGDARRGMEWLEYYAGHWPGDADIGWVYLGRVAGNEILGNAEEAAAAWEELLGLCRADGRWTEVAVKATQMVYGEGIRRKFQLKQPEEGAAFFRQSVALKEGLLGEFPECKEARLLHWGAAVEWGQELGEYERGLAHLEALGAGGPGGLRAEPAPALIVRYCAALEKAGRMSAEEARPRMEAAVETALRGSPRSMWTDVAVGELAYVYMQEQDWGRAAAFLETVRDRPLDRRKGCQRTPFVDQLITCYEKLGDQARAAEVCLDYLAGADPSDPYLPRAQSRLKALTRE